MSMKKEHLSYIENFDFQSLCSVLSYCWIFTYSCSYFFCSAEGSPLYCTWYVLHYYTVDPACPLAVFTHPSHKGEGRAHRAQNQTGTSWRETKRKKTNLKKEKYKKIFIQKNYLAWEYKTDFMKHLWHTVRWKTQFCLYIFNFLFKKLLSNEFLFRLIRKV